MKNTQYNVVVIGGGAAGFFAAINCLESNEKMKVLLLEKSQKMLSKVKISGGGRCNVTHSCFEPSGLIKNYPRGSKELRGPFTAFQPKNTIAWFKERGVELKTESDGRMFPTTNNSQTIIDCLLEAAKNVDIQPGKSVVGINRSEKGFLIHLKSGEAVHTDMVMLATGSASGGFQLAQELDHTIVDPVPSLFTLNIPDSPLHSLAGVSIEHAVVSLPEFKAKKCGPLLITHWGFSGPAVLKLSAFAARELHSSGYKTVAQIDWCPNVPENQLREMMIKRKETHQKKLIVNDPVVDFPKKLWKALMASPDLCWVNVSKGQIEKVIQKLKRDRYQVSGKTTHKEEFVTCGGVKLSEVNFQTMESKIVPGLFFGGEILNIDGITGGFNFQAAWTTGWLAGQAMKKRYEV